MELVVEDAVFVTMAEDAGPPGGMLIRDGRIADIGRAEAVRAAAPGAEVVRLGGATVIPGLIDAHCHVADIGYLAAAADCSQPGRARHRGDPGAAQGRRRAGHRRAPGSPGAGMRSTSSARSGTRREQSWTRPCPAAPAVLYHTSLHACVLNTAALREAGFADGQPDPPGGAFGRDGQGRPTAWCTRLRCSRCSSRTSAGTSPGWAAARTAAGQAAGQRLAAFGLTAACDADMRRDTFAAFVEADAGGLLSQRIYGLVVHDQVGAVRQGRHSGLRPPRR